MCDRRVRTSASITPPQVPNRQGRWQPILRIDARCGQSLALDPDGFTGVLAGALDAGIARRPVACVGTWSGPDVPHRVEASGNRPRSSGR